MFLKSYVLYKSIFLIEFEISQIDALISSSFI